MSTMDGLADYASVKRYLYSLKNRGAKYGIDRMRVLVEALNHPERSFPVIHLAGTNGKGSTSAMLESIYRTAGYRTGLFTSPHLVYQGERVQVNREILSHDAIVALTRKLKEVGESVSEEDPDLFPSFFEFMTGMAFLRFAECAVDVGIIETGLGGRLDATNVVLPEVSVITSIGLDHCEILGNDFATIAGEKAGIIKPGRPVVMGCLPPEAEQVVRRRAAELQCSVHSVREVYGDDLDNYPKSGLEGGYQRINAAVATLVVELLQTRFPVSKYQCQRGLTEVNWPGRWETHQLNDRTIILDATHNAEGAFWLEQNLAKLTKQLGYKPVVLTGTLGQMRAEALMPVVAAHAREIVLLRPHQPRASTFEILETAIPADFQGIHRHAEVREIFPSTGECRAGNSGETLVATGSIYLLGEIMEAIYHQIPVNEETLQD